MMANQLNERYYSTTPPPLPPPKTKKKFLKSPLSAIKNAFLKTTKPLRRQNSMLESDQQRPRTQLRRQHSMLEPRTSNNFRMTPEMSHRQYAEYVNNHESQQRYLMRHEPFQPHESNSTYQNLESEAIYGNCTGAGRLDYYENQQENMYANRALVEFERRARSQQPHPHPEANNTYGGGRIVRRHSMADRGQSKRNMPMPRRTRDPEPQREDIYQTRSGAFMMQNSNVEHKRQEDEAIYQSRKEMHRDHLYQSKKEMQQRIHQGRIEAERVGTDTPVYASRREVLEESPLPPTRDPVYQSRRELKEKGFRTRTQLRDHIYQSRREAMQSMAEPLYVSKREMKHDPIFESRESVINESAAGGQLDVSALLSASVNDTIDTQRDTDDDEDEVEEESNCNNANEAREKHTDDIESEEEKTLTNQSDLQKTSDFNNQNIPVTAPLTPRSGRAPFHISNIIKRTAPPPSTATESMINNVHASRTSIETQYMSQTSLPIGPPNAQSTPYQSTLGLPPVREQSTTHGVFDEHGGTLCDNVWNVSINIPKGAIRPGVQQEIYFTVTDPRLSETVGGPPLDMENGLL